MPRSSCPASEDFRTSFLTVLVFFFQDIKHGGTPLHWAKSKEMVVALIEHGCAVDARNFNGKTALHVAVEYERLECAVALASHGAGVDEPDAEGNTALHMAVAQGSVAVVRALVVFDAATKATNAVSLTFERLFLVGNISNFFLAGRTNTVGVGGEESGRVEHDGLQRPRGGSLLALCHRRRHRELGPNGEGGAQQRVQKDQEVSHPATPVRATAKKYSSRFIPTFVKGVIGRFV